MAFRVGHVRAAANTVTGNQSFTITWADGGSYTPQAAFFMVTTAVADATAVDDVSIGIGAAMSTTQRWAIAGDSDNGLATSDTNSYTANIYCIAIMDGAGAVDGLADFVSFAADTVTVNWTDAPSGAYLVYVMAFAGANAVDVGTFDPSSTNAGTVDVTTLGASANVVIGAMTRESQVFTETPTAHRQSGLSFYTWNGTTANNYYYYQTERTTVSPSNVQIEWSDTIFGLDLIHNFASQDGSIALSNHASGFTVTTTTATTFKANQWGYLALSLPSGVSAKVGSISTKTTTGTQAYTAPGFTPQALLLIGGLVDAAAGSEEVGGPDCEGLFIGGAISAASEFCMNIEAQDSVATTDTQSRSDSVIAYLTTNGNTATIVADLNSFDTSGFTLNYTTTNATARTWVYLAFKDDPILDKVNNITYASGLSKLNNIAKSSLTRINSISK